VKNDVKAFLAGAIFLTLVFSVVAVDLRPAFSGQGGPQVQTFTPWEGDPSAPENPRGIAEFMFGAYALPFEVLSVVLLVALVGALVLAKPEQTEEGP
jgi:NADH:ubiquinone oxidoreductase subunit 6 (subunit J)